MDRAIELLLDKQNRLAYDEQWTLFYSVVAPHAAQFASAIGALPASSGKVVLLIDTALAVVEHTQDAELAKSLLLEALRVNQEVPENYPFEAPPISEISSPGGMDELVRRIGEEMARANLKAALDFVESPEITRWAGGRTVAQVIGAAGQVAPAGALQAAANLGRFRDWARALVAEHVAGTNLELALTIWRELDPDDVDRPNALIRILENASPEAYAQASEVLEAEFAPEPKYQLYKIPTQLAIAAKLREEQFEHATGIAQGSLQSLHDWFDAERWSRPEREFFLARIIPVVTACGLDLVDLAWALVRDITDDLGLQAVSAADVLGVLADDCVSQVLREHFDYEQTYQQLLALGKESDALELMAEREDEVWRRRQKKETRHIEHSAFDLHLRISDKRHWGRNSGGFPSEIIDFSEWLLYSGGPRLLGLYLARYAYHSEWGPDQVLALLAVKTISVYAASALHFAAAIRNNELRQLALVELYGRLPAEVVSRGGVIDQDRLRALALLRVAARETVSVHTQGLLDDAFALARQSIADADEFTLDLLVEFVREAYPIDGERARQFASEMVASTLASSRDWAAHRMFELNGCGYFFSDAERSAIEVLSDHWIDRLEHLQEGSIKGPPIGDQDAHRLAATWVARAARSTLLVNPERGLRLVSMAAHHADKVSEPTERTRLRREILKSILAAGGAPLWEEAVVRSLDFEEAIFHVFDWFGQSALKLPQEDRTFPSRLLDTITWAEQLMTV